MAATTKLFSAGAIDFNYGAALGGTTKQFNGIRNLRYNSQLTEVMEACGLNIDPDFLAVAEQTPAFETDFVELDGFINPATINGLQSAVSWGDTGDDAANKFRAQFAQFEKYKGRFSTASTKHTILTAKRGMAYLKSFRASRRSVASGVLRILPLWNGTDDIVTPAQDVAGLTFSAITSLFTVGPFLWNGTAVGTVTDISFDQGDEIEYAGAGGTEWPDFAAFAGRKPEFTITCKDVPQLVVQTITGAAQSATDSEIYLRGLERNKKRYANATAKHIKLVLDEGRVAIESISAENRKSADLVLKVMPAFDGTNNIIVPTIDTTIPAGE